jgi:hypothetical protein
MNSAELAALGEYLYGKHWVTPMSRDLGVSDRLVRDWASGRRPVPQRRQRQLAEHVAAISNSRIAEERARYARAIAPTKPPDDGPARPKPDR